jgi:hypothetical protein
VEAESDDPGGRASSSEDDDVSDDGDGFGGYGGYGSRVVKHINDDEGGGLVRGAVYEEVVSPMVTLWVAG